MAPRSSVPHSFPPFYACYLLKSIQTPLSKATYIGSTPSPPRRIRQHNGEIAQGAWRTRQKRPWVMQMIIHGFPSRLAALQFEWAWQHPYKSRHLRDPTGKAVIEGDQKSRGVKANIQIVRLMLSSHPYNSWPLHIKIFTDEATKAWDNANKVVDTLPLPLGFTSSVELEGVDGKSGKIGSGRTGPICVEDEQFTSVHLAKHASLLVTNKPLRCSVCREIIPNFTTDSLSTALCPTPGCTSTSHLVCLSKQFLALEPRDNGLVPRGGICTSCHTYTLWGDVVRGCYRRMTGGITCGLEESGVPEGQSDMYDSDEVNSTATLPSSERPSWRKAGMIHKHSRTKAVPMDFGQTSSEGEHFDLDVDSTDTSDTPRRRDRPRKIHMATTAGPVGHSTVKDLSAGWLSTSRKHGMRTEISVAGVDKARSSTLRPMNMSKAMSESKRLARRYSTTIITGLSESDSSGEHFDFDAIDAEETIGAAGDLSSNNFASAHRISSGLPSKAVFHKTVQSRSCLPSSPLKFDRSEMDNICYPKTRYDGAASLLPALSSLSVCSPVPPKKIGHS